MHTSGLAETSSYALFSTQICLCSPFLYINTGFDPYVSSSDSSLQPERFSAPTTSTAAATTTPHNSLRRSY